MPHVADFILDLHKLDANILRSYLWTFNKDTIELVIYKDTLDEHYEIRLRGQAQSTMHLQRKRAYEALESRVDRDEAREAKRRQEAFDQNLREQEISAKYGYGHHSFHWR